MKKLRLLKILFLDILTGDQDVREIINAKIYGGSTYPEAMRSTFGLRGDEWFALDASKGKLPTRLSRFDAIVLGGSTEDPVKGNERPWMKKVYKVIQKAVKQQIPILGICGGLQFVVRAFGGEIIFNPKGREFGSTKIVLTSLGQRDLLFKGLPKNPLFQSSHKCIAKNLLPGWKLLANSRPCKIQAIAIGNTIRLTQFHLELTQQQLKAIAQLRKTALIQEGFGKNDADFKKFLDSIKNTESAGRKVLKNFITYFVLPNVKPK